MINLDTRSREPIYLQIEKQIVKMISLGVYEGNCPLPSVRAMACELGINPNTVARAYKDLEQQSIIYTIGGKGVFVNANNNNKIKTLALSQLEKTMADAKNSGVTKDDVLEITNKLWEENKND